MKKILIDTDPGMDDTLAIILAAKSQETELMGITSVAGNYPIEITTKNALKALELLNLSEISVAKGMNKPLTRPLPKDPFSHGKDGMGEIFLPNPTSKISNIHAVDYIIDAVKANPGEVTIICIAPLTNIAMAIMKEPTFIEDVKELVCLAGSFGLNRYSFENATADNPQAEWNVYVDPEAAKIVFNSGVPLRAIGLDVATCANLSKVQLNSLKKSNRKEARIVEKMVRFVESRGHESYCVLIDSMAVAAVLEPSLVETIEIRVGIETKGELTLGQTIADFRHHHAWDHLPKIKVALKTDDERFLELFMHNILS